MFNVLSAVTVALKLAHFYFFYQRNFRLAAITMFFVYLGYMVVEAWILLDDSTKWSMMMFVALDMAGIVAAVGAWRSRR